ncbi:di-heme-cytochrome C peroxidase [Mongoliimonas terrestris]|uniref:di-heme-cytochrome C peroxidase n=1 Tax=Mongoliimonas terrestris TaxID=1709001 RepID=UPI0011151850|nr:di-heme-cytochrome C peroxidase [Mongoliimonas terrestris]
MSLIGSVLLSILLIGSAAAESAGAICSGSVCRLDQGWTDADRTFWYGETQGSRLLPLGWMLALERADAGAAPAEPFLSEANVRRLGYLPRPATDANPDGLPVGFVVDLDKTRAADLMCDTFPATCDALTMRKPWVGMNCSACHTAEIAYGDKRLRVDGAPTLADFQALEEDLLAALVATVDDRARFDRFARSVLKSGLTVESRAALEAQLTEQIVWQKRLAAKNAAPVRYGHGRLDAQGHILNKVSLTVLGVEQPTDILADAPASYPHIWNTSQQAKIQWNGIANNILQIDLFGNVTDIGSLVRNASEVIGVFAHIETDRGKAYRGYPSSVRVANLIHLERRLAGLKSPRWPEDLLPPIDWERAARGRDLFTRFGCESCHKPLAFDDLTSPAKEQMTPLDKVDTDVFLACNTFLHRSKAGNFEGQKVFAFQGERIPETAFTRDMLVNAVVGSVVGNVDELVGTLFDDVFPGGRGRSSVAFALPDAVDYLPGVTDVAKKRQAEQCLTTEHAILAYKARPLNGIWATAPYLHNGSVPTLYDLLLPAGVRNRAPTGAPAPAPEGPLRPEVFTVGSIAFDPVKVGYRSDAEAPGGSFVFRVRDAATGEPIPGNSNAGHDYGNGALTDVERMDLVEYLKTL